MKSKTCVHIIDPNSNRRAAISYSLRASRFHTEIYEGFWELIDRFPQSGVILVNDNSNAAETIELLEYVGQKGPQLPVALFAESPSTAMVVRAMKHGASSYHDWPFESGEIERAMEEIVRRSESERRKAENIRVAREAVSRLSPRESEVLELLVAGYSNKKIGRTLGISDRTAEIHRSNMLKKLNADSSADAVRIGIYAGLDEKAIAHRD